MPQDSLNVEALLLAAPTDRVRFVLDPWWLEIPADDVLDAELLPAPPGLLSERAQLARLTLRAGFRVHAIGSIASRRHELWAVPRPFALAIPEVITTEAQFASAIAREQEFQRRRGLGDSR